MTRALVAVNAALLVLWACTITTNPVCLSNCQATTYPAASAPQGASK